MFKNKIKYNLLKNLISYEYKSDLTGELVKFIDLINFIYSSEEEANEAKLFSFTIDSTSKEESYKIYNSIITIKNNTIKKTIWNLCPEIHILFYIYYKYGFLNETLMSLSYLYLLEVEETEKKNIGLKFINFYLFYTINQLIQDKFNVFLSFEPKEKIEKFLVKNKKEEYTFKNLYSIKEVVNSISQNYIGTI